MNRGQFLTELRRSSATVWNEGITRSAARESAIREQLEDDMTHSTIEMDAMDNDEPSLEDIAGVSALADDLLDDDEFDGIYGDDLFVEDDDDSYDMSDPYDIEYDIP